MKRVRAHDKKTGELVSMVHAREINEETRRATDYKCLHTGCDCTMHWRKAVFAKENTDPIPATFVKNKTSKHRVNCPGDFERIVRENVDYVTMKDGQINVRVNFPLGSSPIDKKPAAGYLTEQQLAAAHDRRIFKPHSTLKQLVKFIEKNFESLDGEGAAEIVVNYQGRQTEWGKLFIGSDQYDKLFIRSQNYKDRDGLLMTAPSVTIVNPLYEKSQNKHNKRRFACEEQDVYIDGRKQRIIPTIVCDGNDPTILKAIADAAVNKTPLAIAARPFHPGPDSKPARYRQQHVTLMVHLPAQVEPVRALYWKLSHKLENQLSIPFVENAPRLVAE